MSTPAPSSAWRGLEGTVAPAQTCLGVARPEQDPLHVLALPAGDPNPECQHCLAWGGHQSPLGEGVAPSTRSQAGILCSHRWWSTFLSKLSSSSSWSSCCDGGAVPRYVQGDLGELQAVLHAGAPWAANKGTEPVQQSDVTPAHLGELREGADFAWLGLKSHTTSALCGPAQSSAGHSLLSPVPFPSNPRQLSV